MARVALSPVAAAALYSDPILSANIYASGHLCEVIAHLAAPFWKQYRQLSAERGSYLWLLRYARCGEHLKLRLHGSHFELPLLRELLASAQERYFGRCAPPSAAAKRVSAPTAPPIDAEDRVATDYPDRTFLWTSYGRHQISLGFRPYLQDDRYAALLTACLGRGTEVVLERFASGMDGKCPYPIQKALWLDLVLTGLRAVPLSSDDRLLYLLYHRDCLLRYLRKQRHWTDGAAVMARLIARFEQQVDGLALKRHELTQAAAAVWDADSTLTSNVGLAAWFEALSALSIYVSPFLGTASYQIDPFAERPLFPVLFKVLHGMANQLGLDPLNEAFLHHLLLCGTGSQDLCRRPVRLRPDF
jgi:hypothetical protein